MKITYQSRNYDPAKVMNRYVRRTCATGGYDFCEVGFHRYDVRQGTVEADELPENIRKAADEHYKVSSSYIDWPMI